MTGAALKKRNAVSHMETSTHKRRRILLHFGLGIGLPSLFLAHLAFRGIRNDMALLEKERLNIYSAIARQIANSVDETISAAEESLSSSVTDPDGSQPDPDSLASLVHLKSEQPVIEEIFMIAGAGDIRLPLAKLLFLPEGSEGLPALPSGPPRPVTGSAV